MMTIMYMVNALGYSAKNRPKSNDIIQHKNELSEQQGMIIGGLMKKLLN